MSRIIGNIGGFNIELLEDSNKKGRQKYGKKIKITNI